MSAPTGAGKTLIAEYALEKAVAEGRRIIYTAPIKALSNQKFRDFSAQYGDRIGIVTGDVTLNPDASAVIMTTEIFRNTIFDDPERLADVGYVIFDEVHFLDDPERGTVWEESIIFAPEHIRILALSATVPNLERFAGWIRETRSGRLAVIAEMGRPVPLRHQLFIQGFGIGMLKDLRRLDEEIKQGKHRRWETWNDLLRRDRVQEDLLTERGQFQWRTHLLDHLHAQDQFPCLYFIFNRRECEARAAESKERELLQPEERRRVEALFAELCERFDVKGEPSVRTLHDLACRGIAYHHAGMLPTHKEIVERLFTSGLIKLLFATETFALGINMPARTVVFDTLHKFDGVKRSYLKAREYQQMAGRAGRRGIDEVGFVYSNVEWPFARFESVENVIAGDNEEIRSQFSLGYATLLGLWRRLGKDLYEACERSFSNYEHRQRGRGRGRQEGSGYADMVDQVRRRLALLRDLKYIDGPDLTERGDLAAQIYGWELQVTELFAAGLFDRLSEDQLNVVMASLVFEAKKSCIYRRLERDVLGSVKGKVYRLVDGIRTREKMLGVRVLTREADFKLSAAVWAWSRGEDFADLDRYTSASDGDLVRTFRQIAQLERQLLRALPAHDRLAQKLKHAVERISRDEVDAERLLRWGEET